MYSFKLLPQSIEKYMNGKKEYIDIISPSNIPDEFEDQFYKINISTTTLSSNPEIEINAFKMPLNGSIGEVHTLFFLYVIKGRDSPNYIR